MERKTALAKVKRLLGPKAYWKIKDCVTSPEKRQAHSDRVKSTREEKDAASEALKARRVAVLAADTEYQQLLAAWKLAEWSFENVRFHDREAGYKFEVGTQSQLGIFNSLTPKAYGDTWEEIFSKLEAQKAAKAS